MDVSHLRVLRGPNVWYHRKAIELHVFCNTLECRVTDLPGFLIRLRERLPAINGPLSAKDINTFSMAHALELVALTLQLQAGCSVGFSHTKQTHQSGLFQVIIEYTEESVGRLAIELAIAFCRAVQDDTPFDLAKALVQLEDLDEDVRLGPSTRSIVDAAVARGIPFRRLTEGSLVQFGWGSKQRRIQACEIDKTSAISEKIAQDKALTKKILIANGIPVPRGRTVTSIEDTFNVAAEIGLPVVIKPRDGRQGKGVTANITTQEQLIAAYHFAAQFPGKVLVERYIPGKDFRLLVVGDKLVAAARRDPPSVTGDGQHTIRELIEQLNQDPRRGTGHGMPLTQVIIDSVMLAKLTTQGCNLDSVPHVGQCLILRDNANLSSGGSATDVTDEVHPAVAECAIKAAQAVGLLNPCGVDLVCENVHKPLEEQKGGVVEVNAAPGLRMHLSPSYGQPRPVGDAIVNAIFGPSDDGRIPVIAVTGTNGKTTTVCLIAHLLKQHGIRIGMTSTEGIFINGRKIESGDCSGPKSAGKVLLHPDVDAAVFETARGGLLREGLGFDRCQVAVVTNIGRGDHLGIDYVHTAEELALLKRTILSNITASGVAVLNASDHLVAGMAKNCPASIIYFSMDSQNALIAEHRAMGQRVIYTEENYLVAVEGDNQYRISLTDIPITHDGNIQFQIENVMASTAAAWAVGIEWRAIMDGLKTFINDKHNAPGRFNLFKHRGATLIADYGHNPDAIHSLVRAVETMPANRRSVVLCAAGDRLDECIRQLTQILGDAFDDVFLYHQPQCQRGRADGTVVNLLREGLVGATRTTVIEEIHGERPAIDRALARLNQGDLCLLLIDQIDDSLEHIMQQIDHR